MKIPAGKIDAFVERFDKSLAGVLLYGPEVGLIEERAEVISKQISPSEDPFLNIELEMGKIKESEAALYDELSALSFSSGRKVIKVRDANEGLAKILKELPDENMFEGENAPFLLILTEELPPRSSLRQLFENQGKFAAIPCYKDDETSLALVVRKRLKDIGFSFDEDVPDTIAQFSLGNRMVMTREIEKLEIYMGERRRITMQDVSAVIVDTAELSLEELVHATADRDIERISYNLKKALAEGVNAITIFRYLTNYFFRLINVTEKIKNGETEIEAINSLRPPIFFKQMPSFRRHVGYWSKRNLHAVIAHVYDAEVLVKSNTLPAEVLISRKLIEITRI